MLSLVICTYNRDRFLKETFESIVQQDFDKSKYEVVLIDNNSTDRTAEYCKQFVDEHPEINIVYYFEGNKGLSYARNRGIKESKYDIICYIDDDVILSPNYLSEISKFYLNNPNAQGSGGIVIPKYEDGAPPKWSSKYVGALSGENLVSYGNVIEKYHSKIKYPFGCIMTYKKDILLKAGGFNNNLTFRSDDKDIYNRVRELTDEIYFIPTVVLQHYIDRERLQFPNFKKLYLKSGNEERRRIQSQGSTIQLIKKFVELVIKYFAGIIIAIGYTLQGQYAKGKYAYLAMYYTLKGFLVKDVFVR